APSRGKSVSKRGRAAESAWPNIVPGSTFIQHGIDFSLDEPFRIDKAAHLHDRVDRPDVTEELPVDFGNYFPVLDSGEEDSSPDNVLTPAPDFLQRRAQNLKPPPRLSLGTTNAYCLSMGAERCSSRHSDEITDSHSARKSDDWLVGTTSRD